MSITIISTLSAPASGAANVSSILAEASENAGAGNFASLLLGQLLAGGPLDAARDEDASGKLLSGGGEDDLRAEAEMAALLAMPAVPELPLLSVSENLSPDSTQILSAEALLDAPVSADEHAGLVELAAGLTSANAAPAFPATSSEALPAARAEYALAGDALNQKKRDFGELALPMDTKPRDAEESPLDLLKSAKPDMAAATAKSAKIADPAPAATGANPANAESRSGSSSGSASGNLTFQAALSGAAGSANSSSPANADTRLSVPTPLGKPDWSNDFGDKIVWLAKNDRQSAQLTLNPPQTGPIEVSLSLNRNTASAVFISANPDVRESIETALPRLREMFANAGIELGQTHVGAESFQQQAHGGNPADSRNPQTSRWMDDKVILVETSAEVSAGLLQTRGGMFSSGKGVVDIFA